MGGLGILIFGVIFAFAGISAAMENRDMKRKPYNYMPDGTPMYLDRKCRTWINGERVVPKYDYDTKKLIYVGERTGNLIYDQEQAMHDRMDAESEKNKQEAIEKGYLAYKKFHHKFERYVTAEVETDKFIAYLFKNTEFKCFKGYLKEDAKHASDEEDEEAWVEITEEEFSKLDIVGSSHKTVDTSEYARYELKMKRQREYRRKLKKEKELEEERKKKLEEGRKLEEDKNIEDHKEAE